jgi:hypothetical protein
MGVDLTRQKARRRNESLGRQIRVVHSARREPPMHSDDFARARVDFDRRRYALVAVGQHSSRRGEDEQRPRHDDAKGSQTRGPALSRRGGVPQTSSARPGPHETHGGSARRSQGYTIAFGFVKQSHNTSLSIYTRTDRPTLARQRRSHLAHVRLHPTELLVVLVEAAAVAARPAAKA